MPGTGDAWVGSYNLGPIHDTDRRIVGAVVTARDITERRPAEEQPQERNLDEDTRDTGSAADRPLGTAG
ncbi:hypothetical protein [Halochromatium glycolicum]|uniref:PAC domain-containing protein n=1 Tax=Halochromatium glycolicum TaxID=85075 RepID=A0AAJ0XAR7_9GAMM|nr:hypothetical protein [Halochromatium glycolicum]MBK1705127.1 hypothetical protein [Halochromatium glycolicum]